MLFLIGKSYLVSIQLISPASGNEAAPAHATLPAAVSIQLISPASGNIGRFQQAWALPDAVVSIQLISPASGNTRPGSAT